MENENNSPPSWALSMMERVEIEDIYRRCKPTAKDLQPYLPESLLKAWQEHVISEKEYIHFWYREEASFEFYTIFYAYLDQYIFNPKCCRDNRSQFESLMLEGLNEQVLSKISRGYQMLDEIINADNTLFPSDEDDSIYSRIELFFFKYSNTCCSCTTDFRNQSSLIPPHCSTCVKHEIIKEELLHSEHRWVHTGFKNMYMCNKVEIGVCLFVFTLIPLCSS